jgi:hypothetical protein
MSNIASQANEPLPALQVTAERKPNHLVLIPAIATLSRRPDWDFQKRKCPFRNEKHQKC